MRNRTTARRRLARLATVATGIAVPVLTATSSALALHPDDGGGVGAPPLGAGLTILYFVVIPVGAFLLIAAFSLLPSALSRPRYRPGKPWEFGARWFGSAEPSEAPGSGSTARGGASAEW